MKISLEKKGIRVLGVAESFKKEVCRYAVLVGVVMRSDLIVDGVVVGRCTVGGMDSTEAIINMYKMLNRTDISTIMLNGCIISWFNVVDLNKLHVETGLPVIALTYYPSTGLREYFMKYFPDSWEERLRVYEENGLRVEIRNKNGFKIYVRAVGIDIETATNLIDKYTLFGKIPEPLRLAKLIAHSILLEKTS
ncbi:MAG: DUF99 family protein [Nitrososphaerota archaeon]